MPSFGLEGESFSRVICILIWSRSKKLNFIGIRFKRGGHSSEIPVVLLSLSELRGKVHKSWYPSFLAKLVRARALKFKTISSDNNHLVLNMCCFTSWFSVLSDHTKGKNKTQARIAVVNHHGSMCVTSAFFPTVVFSPSVWFLSLYFSICSWGLWMEDNCGLSRIL